VFDELIQLNTKDNQTDRVFGLVKGVVRQNYDKEQPGMLKVEYHLGEKGKMVTGWIPVMTPYAATEGGMFFFPEVDTEVIIAFLMGKTDCPVVIGSLWNKKIKKPASAMVEKNITKLLKTEGGHTIEFSDEKGKEKITVKTKAEMTLMMDDEKKMFTIKDKDGKNKIEFDTGKGELSIEASKKITLKVGSTQFAMESSKLNGKSSNVEFEGQSGFKAKGQTTNIEGTSTTIKAQGSLKLQASGIAELKGSMVKVN